jgi:predicted transcriptional regulator
MSVLTDVLREARGGATTDRIAANLGIDAGLAEAAVDHWVRLGIVSRSGDVLGGAGCHGCEPTPGRSLACAGCVFAKRTPGR